MQKCNLWEKKHKKGNFHDNPGLLPEGNFGTATKKGEKHKYCSHTELRRQDVEFRTAKFTGLGTKEKKTVQKGSSRKEQVFGKIQSFAY